MEHSKKMQSLIETEANCTINEYISPSVQNNWLELLHEGIIENTEESIAYEKNMTDLLHVLHVEPKSLANSIKEELDKACLVLRAEGLSDIDEINLQIAKQRSNLKEMEKKILSREMASKAHVLDTKVLLLEQKISDLQKSIDHIIDIIFLEKKNVEDSSVKNIQMNVKLNEYNETIAKLEADIDNMGIKDLLPSVIANKYKQYMEMTNQLAELNQFLEQYNDLPPDLLHAQMVVESKQKEYEQLEQTFLQHETI